MSSKSASKELINNEAQTNKQTIVLLINILKDWSLVFLTSWLLTGYYILLPLKSEEDISNSNILVDGYLKQITHKVFMIW